MLILLFITSLNASMLDYLGKYDGLSSEAANLKGVYAKTSMLARSGFSDDDALDIYLAFKSFEDKARNQVSLEEWTEYLAYKKKLLTNLDMNLNLALCKIQDYSLVRYLVWGEVGYSKAIQDLELARCLMMRNRIRGVFK